MAGVTKADKTMNTKIKFGIVSLALVLIGVLQATAQVTAANFFNATNLPAIVNQGAVSNNIASFYTLKQNTGVAFTWQWNCNSNASVSTAAIFIYPSADGTNYSSSPIIYLAAPALGTTNQTVTTNLSALQLAGYIKLQVGQITNAVNNGILTNKIALFNRWNLP